MKASEVAGDVTNLVYHVGNPGVLPSETTDPVSFRVGDYSTIQYSDDGFVYGSTQNSYLGTGGSFDWGTPILSRCVLLEDEYTFCGLLKSNCQGLVR
jgi:hypothetical protein